MADLSDFSDADLEAIAQGKKPEIVPTLPWGEDQSAPQKETTMGRMGNRAVALMRGVPFVGGAIDEGYAGAKALIAPSTAGSLGRRYLDELSKVRTNFRTYDRNHPLESEAAKIVGGLGAGGLLNKLAPGAASTIFGLGGRTLPQQAITSARAGATLGGADAFTRGEGGFDERLGAAERGAVTGGLVGAVTPSAVGRVGRVVGDRPPVPSNAELINHSKALYDFAEQSGVRLRGQNFDTMLNRMERELRQEGIDLDAPAGTPSNTPQANRAFARLRGAVAPQQQGGAYRDLSIQDTDLLHKIIGGVANNPDRTERNLANIMRNHLDDYIDALPNNHANVSVGNPNVNVGETLNTARALWSRARKGQDLDELYNKARIQSYLGGDIGDHIKSQFAQLASDPRRMRGYSQAEQEAIRSVYEGTHTRRVLEGITKLTGSFGDAAALAGLLAGRGEGLGLKVAGPLANRARNMMVSGEARAVADQARLGRPVPPRQLSQGSEQMMRRLVASGTPAFSDYLNALNRGEDEDAQRLP